MEICLTDDELLFIQLLKAKNFIEKPRASILDLAIFGNLHRYRRPTDVREWIHNIKEMFKDNPSVIANILGKKATDLLQSI